MEEPVRKNYSERGGKAQKVIRKFGAQTQIAEKGKETYPMYDKCNNHHGGRCIICLRCNKGGHFAKDCRSEGRRTCHECRSPDHFRNACPRLNRGPVTNPTRPVNQGNQGGQARGQAFEIGVEEARQNPNMVTGTFFLNNRYVSVLFDSGADRSFLSLEFRPNISLKSQKLKEDFVIEFANRQVVRTKDVIKNCTLRLAGQNFSIDLISIRLGSFDVVVGMDWLSKNQAEICCSESMKMRKYLKKEYVTFLAHIVDKGIKEKHIQDFPIVWDFLEVFPDDLPGLPPLRQVKFHIDLIPRAAPVAKSPYRLAPSKMKELSEQHDILIYSQNKEEHEQHLKLILEMLGDQKLLPSSPNANFGFVRCTSLVMW
ncbi:uncharacterized protein LOC112524999 [Cynara cardunculus var. scolymus]|uniref:uncharacterized protein LOC112524999 n=1 Tax=Cynara cardunculus var. scolymus TaxID=59895 RepID=UPI000D62454E|nr:uncharacterized protein LOC112524999 [Cynara cardunculus var. scolymus]